jgi:hypothetical protein
MGIYGCLFFLRVCILFLTTKTFSVYTVIYIIRTIQRTMDRFAKLPFAEKLKDTAGMIDAVKMVLFDVIIHLPVIYFPTYYTVKEFVSGSSWNPANWVRVIDDTGRNYHVLLFFIIYLPSKITLEPINNYTGNGWNKELHKEL